MNPWDHPHANRALLLNLGSMIQSQGVWARYAEGTAGREPMEFLDVALNLTDGNEGDGRLALDLGCGAGNEVLALLQRGWRVHAVDGESRAIEILEARVPAELEDHLTTEVALFHEAALPGADLVFASLSLPFAAEHLLESVGAATAAVRELGWFVGVFLGHNDSWASLDDVATVDSHDIEGMLTGLEIRHMDEAEFDGSSGAGPKHWHWYVVGACRPGSG